MTTDIKKHSKVNIVILIGIFLTGVILHYFFGYFSKSIDVLPDEIRYYSIARSIFQGDGLTFRGVPTDYQKMGYTLFLVPFFLIKDGILRIKAISLANSIVMMSSIFPMYGIMNRLGISSKVKMVFLAIFIVFPDLMFSASFMAEVLYWPILLLFFYLWIINREKSSYALSIAMGVIAYIGYSTKEIFLAVVLGVVVFELLFPIAEHLFNRGVIEHKLRENYSADRFKKLAVFVLSFAVVYLVVKLIFFMGLGNSYDQMDIDAIASPAKFGYMIYGFFYYLAAIVIATLVLPIILPGMLYRQLSDRARELYIFNIFCILSAVATIAYTITVREDYGDIIPRLHFRYLGPMLIVAIIVYLYCIDAKDIVIRLKKNQVITIIVTLFVSFGLFRGVTVITGVDQFVLNWIYSFTEALGGFWGLLIVEIIIVIAVAVAMTFLWQGKNRLVIILSMVALFVMGVFNSYTARDRLMYYMQRDEDMVDEAIKLNEWAQTVDGGILYIGEHKTYTATGKCIETFVDLNDNLYYVSRHGISKQDAGVHDVTDLTLPMQQNLWKMKYTDMDNIEYVIDTTPNGEYFNAYVNNITLIPELSGKYYRVYKNNDSSKLSIVKTE